MSAPNVWPHFLNQHLRNSERVLHLPSQTGVGMHGRYRAEAAAIDRVTIVGG